MIYIGADHGGFNLKNDLVSFLKNNKYKITDLGPKKLSPEDDYPDISVDVVNAVKKDLEKNKGILICRSGEGVCIAANRHKGIRAALVWNESVAKMSRQDENSNVLCLPSDFISTEAAEDIVKIWLETTFSFEERHMRRIKKVEKLP